MDEMSASTRTIQQPMAKGSFFGAALLAVAVLLAVVAIAWAATNLVATKSVATPVQTPILLDRGSRGELGAPVAAPAPGNILDRGGRGDILVRKPDGGRVKDDNAFGGGNVTGPSSVGASSAAHATGTPAKAPVVIRRHFNGGGQ
jgi:hypothetical protein